MAQTLGKYILVRKLATGGMAEVFLARSDGPMGFQKKLVVKRILPHFGEDQNFINMFLSEARLAAELNHPNVVQIFDFGQTDGQFYIAMEYIDGPNLRALNKAARGSVGPIALPLCARIISLAAEGLGYAHDLKDSSGQQIGLVHRDISPDNILVSRSGSVKVVDFGIAKANTQPHHTKSGVIKGKLAYMPPEQLAREPLDRRTDIFALGVVLYELACGAMPFDATSEVSIIQAIMGTEPLVRASIKRPDLPPPLDAIISKCLEKDPSRRFSSCRELQMELERYIASTGEVVSVADIGKLVEHLFPEDHESTLPNAIHPGAADGAFEKTALSGSNPNQTINEGRRSQVAQAEPAPRRGGLIGALVGALVVMTAAIGVLLLKPRTVEPTPVPPLPPVVAEVDAGPAQPPVAVAPVATEDAGAVAANDSDAGTTEFLDSGVAEVAPAQDDAGIAAELDAGSPAVATLKTGRMDFRIRPVGQVYVDGKFIGETPLGKDVALSVGPHLIKVIEPGSKKVFEKSFNVKAGRNVFSHNFALD